MYEGTKNDCFEKENLAVFQAPVLLRFEAVTVNWWLFAFDFKINEATDCATKHQQKVE